jgi:hypothetical protein
MTASDMPEWAIPTQSSRAQGVGDFEAAYFDPRWSLLGDR